MQINQPPVVLIFGPFDPSGSSSLLADTVTLAHLGCHTICAATANMLRDSMYTEHIEPASAEYLDDQARFMLEDVTVKAIKVGPIYSIEAISVIAQIAADYSNLPLVLQPTAIDYEVMPDSIYAEEVQEALLELLLPLTDIVITSGFLLNQWLADGLLPDNANQSATQRLLSLGCNWILATESSSGNEASCNLYNQTGLVKSFPYAKPPQGLHDAEGPLACAVTAGLASGMDIESAAQYATKHSMQQLQHYFKPGMGNPFYNRTVR